MSRARNEASPHEVMKVMRQSYKALDAQSFNMAEHEKLIELHADFLGALLQLTSRPTEKVLTAAGMLGFPEAGLAAVQLWASQMCKAVQWARKKQFRITTGRQQTPQVLSICKLLARDPSPTSDSNVKTTGSESSDRRQSFSSSSRQVSAPAPAEAQVELDPARILASYKLKSKKHMLGQQCPGSPVEILSSQDGSPQKQQKLDVPASSAGQQCPTVANMSTIYLDSTRRALVRVHDGQVQVARMIEGPSGFARGQFEGECIWHDSEMPNLLLALDSNVPGVRTVLKKPAAVVSQPAAVLKKPAAVDSNVPGVRAEMPPDSNVSEDEVLSTQEYADEVEDSNVLSPPAVHKKYLAMWYKNSSAYGIRRCFSDKKQIFTVRSRDGSMSQAALKHVADAVLLRLHTQNMSEEDARAWSISQT